MKKILALIIFTSTFISAQTYIKVGEIGNFDNANSFSISSTGFFYVTDVDENQLTKIDTTGEKISSIGGFGWEKESFDFPANVFATALNIYLCDRNNNRILFYDKELNFLEELQGNNSEPPFAYPISSQTNVQGDLFVLEKDNSRILKYNIDGKFLLKFGDFQSGNFTFSEPKNFSIDENMNLYVLNKNSIIIFDSFGSGLLKLNLEKEFNNLSLHKKTLLVNSDKEIYSSPTENLKINLKELTLLPKVKKIISTKIFNKKLYILTPNEILIYKKN